MWGIPRPMPAIVQAWPRPALWAAPRDSHPPQCRQTLSGSDYGLINEQTLQPTPEFWATVLWRQLMGADVFAAAAEGAPATLRVYCHRASATNARGRRNVHGSRSRSCVALNLDDAEVALLLPSPRGSESARVWLLEAIALDAAALTINGMEPALADDGSVPPLPAVQVSAEGRLLLPPNSAAFVAFGA